ncbi:MAG: hypothetical protein U9O94_08595, partial [Nanoarchaeota archaeon]|nr:hypothetical protein [Nanoarchaeota archaeon]
MKLMRIKQMQEQMEEKRREAERNKQNQELVDLQNKLKRQYIQDALENEKNTEVFDRSAEGTTGNVIDKKKIDKGYTYDPFTGKFSKEKKTAKEKYRSGLRSAISGEISWDSLIEQYPDKEDELRSYKYGRQPVTKSPDFKEGGGLPALFSKNMAKIDASTQEAIDAIENEKDWMFFMDNQEALKNAGVDIDAVLEWFGRR